MHRRTGVPVYRYFYTHPRPPMKEGRGNDVSGLAGTNENAHRVSPPLGAVHSAEIEYALGNLSTNDLYAWTPEDRQVSEHLQSYVAHFVRTGDPNGPDRPTWPAAGTDDRARLLRIDATPDATVAPHQARYELLDQLSSD
jgi:para-nitrobenzyl esterase